jgi:hypothetical protein
MTRVDRWPGEPLPWLIEQTAAEIADTVGYLELIDVGRALSPADPSRQELIDQLAVELAEAVALIHELARRWGIDPDAPPLVASPAAEPVVVTAPRPRPGEDR